MTNDVYKKLKKQNGEKFAQTLRNFHSGILEIPDVVDILRYAGRVAEPLLPHLMSLLASNDDAPQAAPQDPFALLDQAGYDAFYADTLEKQNSIAHYFEKGELLCTFNSESRHENYHIVHAVKKDVEQINRADFRGKEERQDAYGTSVISIQILKEGGFISIKNRYNHSVAAPDNTFGSNPDNIISGLSVSLKQKFNVDFTATKSPLPDNYTVVCDSIFKFHTEMNNYYYGDQVWAKDGVIHKADRSKGDALFNGYLFNNKTKTFKNVDPENADSFPDDFNRDYGGRSDLYVKDGNLMLGDHILIGAEEGQIRTIDMPELTAMGDSSLRDVHRLVSFSANSMTGMGNNCLHEARSLVSFSAISLTAIGNDCLYYTHSLTEFTVLSLTTMGARCLCEAQSLISFTANSLTFLGRGCLGSSLALTLFSANNLIVMEDQCLFDAPLLTFFTANKLVEMGRECLFDARVLTSFIAPNLRTLGYNSLNFAPCLAVLSAPKLTHKGHLCLEHARLLDKPVAQPVAMTAKTLSL